MQIFLCFSCIFEKSTSKQIDYQVISAVRHSLQFRKLLPDTIDFYYCAWHPAAKVMQERSSDILGNEYHFPECLPMIIPNPHALISSSPLQN